MRITTSSLFQHAHAPRRARHPGDCHAVGSGSAATDPNRLSPAFLLLAPTKVP
jgi:hypothetical protein